MTPLATCIADRWDLVMVLGILACLLWLRSLRAENAQLRIKLGRGAPDDRPVKTPAQGHFIAVIERDLATRSLVAAVLGIPGLHAQAPTLEELEVRLREVAGLLEAEAALVPMSEFVGVLKVSLGREQ